LEIRVDGDTYIPTTVKRISAYLPTIIENGVLQMETLTVCSELVNNIRNHAGQGSLVINKGEGEIVLIAKDSGKGFKNTRLIIKEGYSTAGSLGIGIPAIIRFSDELNMVSNAKGVEIRIKKALK